MFFNERENVTTFVIVVLAVIAAPLVWNSFQSLKSKVTGK